MSRQGKNFEPFKKVDTWIFDLDNTLYPAHSNLFDPIDARMKMYIAAKLDIKPEQAYRIQKDLYHRYGTTLYGLMNLYGVEPKEFLDYVHNTELQHIEPNKPLSEAISGLDGKKYIFTNSRLSHAENITRQLGILQDFDGIFDIKDSHYIPKPYKASYTRFLQQFSINPQRAAMFEDLPKNLKIPSQMGLVTILVEPAPNKQTKADERSEECKTYIDYLTEDLVSFPRLIKDNMNK